MALCSLLIGLGYDAYVVSGYATQDTCQKNLKRIESPFPPEKEKKVDDLETAADTKYTFKKQKDLRSKFILAMAQREVDKVLQEEERIAEKKRKEIEELEKPQPDDLYGLRIHSWVLLLAGLKEVETSCFIEASTGNSYPLSCNFYIGIESVWNHNNYWVNLQECLDSLDLLDYDFSNTEKWEHLLVAEPLKWREAKISREMEEEEIQLITTMDEKHLDMPTPWSLRISIPHEVLKQRFPQGVRKTYFKRTIVEQYAAYVQQDGLVTRIDRYNDLDYTGSELYAVEEYYENRSDKLIKIYKNYVTNFSTEHFSRGREDAVISHAFQSGEFFTPDSDRTITFCAEARHDGLAKLAVDNQSLTEYYEDPENPMYYRQTRYRKKSQSQASKGEVNRRSVNKIIEKYRRNPKIPASEDVAVREFAIVNREIHLKYHYEESTVTASTRDFYKPSIEEMGEQLKWRPDLTIGYQARTESKVPRQLQLYFMLEEQLLAEESALHHIREMEDLITEFLKVRCNENVFPHLEVSLFDIEHNHEFKEGMKQKEQEEKEYREREVEDEIDYLAPYLARLGNPKSLNNNQAVQVVNWCLGEFKQMLIDRANTIQQEFERMSSKYYEKQMWYTNVQDTLTQEAENAYFEEVNQTIFLLHSLELRLIRHKDLSPVRYQTLETYIQMDPRLTMIYFPNP